MDKQTLIVCNCSSLEHQMVIDSFEDQPDDAYISIHLTKHSFFKRLWYGLRYIFGYQCKYGAFEEVIVDKDRLIESIEGCKNPGVYADGDKFVSGKESSQFQRNTAKVKQFHNRLMEKLSEILDCDVYTWSDSNSYSIYVILEAWDESTKVTVFLSHLLKDIEAGHTDFEYFKTKYDETITESR